MSWLDLPTDHLDVEGCRVVFRRLGPRGGRPLLLVHGGGAHAGWWLEVAPALAERHDVLVIELSGYGESGHRDTYAPAQWARECAAVIEAAGAGAADVVGHSMGALVSLVTAARFPTLAERLVMIDCGIVKPGPRPPTAQVKFYPTFAEGLANFRLRPRGTTASPETLARVGAHGLVHTEDGWRWRFDPRALWHFDTETIAGALDDLECPVGFVWGEHSELSDESVADAMSTAIGRRVPRIEVLDAFHHVPVDQPVAIVEAVERLLGELTEDLARPDRAARWTVTRPEAGR